MSTSNQRIFLYLSYLIAGSLVLTLFSGCALLSEDNKKSSSSSKSSKVVDIEIPDYEGSALMVLNTSVGTYSTGQSIGTPPSSLKMLKHIADSILRPAPCIQFKLDTQINIKQKPFHLQAIESLTEENLTANFKTYNLSSGSPSAPIIIEGTLQYAGTHCLIYVETGYNSLLIKNRGGSETPLSVNWAEFGDIFDTQIYANETPVFGFPEDVDNNNKVIIFYYKFDRGDLDEESDTGFIAGYFWPYDLVSYRNYYSNQKDMLYINLACVDVSQNIETVAHEFKHLTNFSERVINRNLEELDTWISEGLAECAAHIGLNTPLTSQIENMKSDAYIRNGYIPLIEWSSTAQQYALTYTFFQYVRIQSTKGNTILSNINIHPYPDYRSIEEELSSETDSPFTDFESIVSAFHIANIVNQPTGKYGYKNNAIFSDFNNLEAPIISSVTLYSGAAVYYYPTQTELENFEPKNSGSKIAFYRINP